MGTFTYGDPEPRPTAIERQPPAPVSSRRLRGGSPVERIVGAIFVLWAAATFMFFMQAAAARQPRDDAAQPGTRQQKNYSKAQLMPVEEKYGFDKSVLDQYLDYIEGVAHGDLGTSYPEHEPVMKIICEQVGPTLVLTVTALILAWAIALLLTMATAKRGRFVSSFGSGCEIFTAGLPYYWLGDHPADRVLDRTEGLPGAGWDELQGTGAAGADAGPTACRIHRTGHAR